MTYNPNIPARPTMFRGILMRSRTESRYAAWLDTWCAWEYEGTAFRDADSEYLPDFRLHDVPLTWAKTLRTVFVEVKPACWLTEVGELQRRSQLKRMAAIFDSDPDAVVIIEQSGLPGRPQIVRLDDDGRPATFPARWFVGLDNRPALGLVETFEWGEWPLASAA
jgi:hypothetical protein